MTSPKPAPPGFTKSEWEEFEENGLIHLDDRIDPESVDRYLDIGRQLVAGMVPSSKNTNKIEDLVLRHRDLQELIDHERHIGFAYDIFGDTVRLSQNDMIVRQPGAVVNHWHIDGPRAVPFRVFSPVLPLKLRIGYWLTDVPHDEMGNLVYLPGSHRAGYDGEHTSTGTLPGERVLRARAGSITVFHASLWHRVQPNNSTSTRVNFFLSYTPSWISGYRFYDPQWAASLTRERRIIVRPYGEDQERFIRPPAADLPLFDDPDSARTVDGVEKHKVRRLTRYEREFASSHRRQP
ncbi:phytanoyl-CoA dioxygenase family protein [Micromonospora sp. STR1_7]|uniref:Phytanoyl-CoA dioxygenase family protein n=1 Tax=Micromonospora parastrephiae TaxID=2806101 RepID=A0ABS1XN77_9ACTN|nr:phytanoyl-CoA dioxygenase family protein [Micromonospora parastrephiae]MBM0230711.1 phytanoyl-CoA dioxygenase family protein [Micromonospora parastrephiae]